MPTVTPDPVAVALTAPGGSPSAPTAYRVAGRSLYLYYSRTVSATNAPGTPLNAAGVVARALYTYYSRAIHGWPSGGEPLDGDDVLARILYLYYSLIHDRDPSDVANRALYTYGAWDNTELFPWIEKIAPTEQLPGGQIQIHGDGFGATEGAEGSVVRLGTPPDPTELGPGTALGIVTWASRSAGLHPANSGTPTSPAITATLPEEAESGMISVEQTT